MKYQIILLFLALFAIFARDVTCEKNENEPDENEPDEDEGGHNGNNMKAMSHMAKNNMAMMSSSSSALGAAAMPSATVSMASVSSGYMMPTGSVSGMPSGWSSAASDASVWQSSVIGAASSWVASVGGMPSATYGASVSAAMSSLIPMASVSPPRPYAGPSVISASSRIEVFSIAIATIGVFGFIFILA